MTSDEVKRATVEQMLEKTHSVLIELDPRCDGVLVPGACRAGAVLVLEFGLNLPLPIEDLRVGPDSIDGTLSFDRRGYYCVVPWSAVLGVFFSDTKVGVRWADSLSGPEGRSKPAALPPPPARPASAGVVSLDSRRTGADRAAATARRARRLGL